MGPGFFGQEVMSMFWNLIMGQWLHDLVNTLKLWNCTIKMVNFMVCELYLSCYLKMCPLDY